MNSNSRLSGTMLLLIAITSLIGAVMAQEPTIEGTGLDGITRQLPVSRYPTLYTGDFDDCMGGNSLFNVTKFDTAYYTDNLTVLFHLDGTTNVRRESVIMHISLEAYGETRFNMTYEPCAENIDSMCPMNADEPIEAFGVIPIAPSDIVDIPSLSLDIPDFEGFARLLIFENSTESQIGCFQAVLTNGQTLSQPQYVGSIVGAFTFLAVLASFLTAIYGVKIASMRMHYAHSFSVLVMFETLHSIFFSGALSVNWPSVLPAWWSNFGWSAGMIADETLIRSISSFTGNNGNTSQVGGGSLSSPDIDSGVRSEIFGRSLALFETVGIARRGEYDPSNPYDYAWRGDPRTPGMPLPGTWQGFGGTLTPLNIPNADAFTLGIIWLAVILGAVVVFIVAFKVLLELLAMVKILKNNGFDYFRSHLLGYVAAGVLRTLFIAFFAIMTLAMYQFSLTGPTGPIAVAAVVCAILIFGLGGIAFYAWRVRAREGKFEIATDSLQLYGRKFWKFIPYIGTTRASKLSEMGREGQPHVYGSVPLRYIKFVPNDASQATAHQDEAYVKRFGWLSARYRHSRWWFYSIYLAYQLVRACFIGGAASAPMAQVFGLFAFEVLALAAIWMMSPFEGARNTAVAVYLLSISKIITTGLSIAFLPTFEISRTAATVLGLIIIVVQGFLMVAVLILVVLGLISSWMSLSRNRENFLRPLDPVRITYYEHVHTQATGLSLELPNVEKDETTGGTFNVKDVRRLTTIEDEDTDAFPAMDITSPLSPMSPMSPSGDNVRRSRANSASSRYSVGSLPRGARAHRASWSSKDFAQWDAEMSRADPNRASRARSNSLRMQTLNQRSGAMSPPNGLAVKRPMTPTREHSMELPSLTVKTDMVSDARRISEEGADGGAPGRERATSEAVTPTTENAETRPVSRRTVSPMTPTDHERERALP